MLFPFNRENKGAAKATGRRRREEDNVSSPHPLPFLPPPPPSCLFINRDFFCYSIADSIDDLSHAASLCNYAGECTTRNKIAEKSIRNAATRTASKIASSHQASSGENNRRRVYFAFLAATVGEGGKRPTTRVIDCGTHGDAIFLFVAVCSPCK